jgi:dynein heavy chain 1
MNPEAYVTATRQCVAQANSWSLEELQLEVTVGGGVEGGDSFAVVGLKLQGAQCRNNQLLLASTILSELPPTLLTWARGGMQGAPGGATQSTAPVQPSNKISLPVYLNSTRTELLFTVDLLTAPGQEHHSFYERGVALLTSTALN